MKSSTLVLFAIALTALAVIPLNAQDKPAFVNDYLGQVMFVEGQIMSLEEAVPAEKYSWRPSEGVRSIGETYRHMAFGNYLLTKTLGTEPPADVNFSMDLKKWDTAITDKAKIGAGLKASIDHLKMAAGKLTEANLAEMVELFGNKMTKRSLLMSSLNHLHEHLGQSIAYARMNNIVPPWTAAELAKEAEKAKTK